MVTAISVDSEWVEVFAHTRFASAAVVLAFAVFATGCLYLATRYGVLTIRVLHGAIVDGWAVLARVAPPIWRWLMTPMDPAKPEDMALPLVVPIYMVLTGVTIIALATVFILYYGLEAAFPARFGLATWKTVPLLVFCAVFTVMLKVGVQQTRGAIGILGQRWQQRARRRP